MSGFLLPAALLVLLAVAFAVSMLWQRSRGLAIALAVVLPLAAASLYAWRGTPAALDPQAVATPAPAEPTTGVPAPQPADIEGLVAELERKLAEDPSQWEGWALLGRVRMEQGNVPGAVEAFAKAHALVPDNDAVAVGYAEALLRASPEGRFPPEAVAMLEKAARAEVPDERALFFLGMHRMLSGAPGEAADLWERLLPRLDPTAAQALLPQIAAAREAAARIAGGPAPAAAGPALALTVEVAPELAARAKAGAVLYVFARPATGGPPVAAKRIDVGSWPLQVTLGDADRPMPTAKLSDHAEVLVTARLSLTGNAMGATGDLESEPVKARVADGAPVALRLDRVRP
jgi:cytochrome c-type biogenesis protein CcmH